MRWSALKVRDGGPIVQFPLFILSNRRAMSDISPIYFTRFWTTGARMAEFSDVLVIGAGPGGYVAAIRAAQLGLKTTIVERSHLGGICLNWGCIPTKALLTTGELFELLSQLKKYGVSVEAANYDLPKLVKRSRTIAQQLSSGVAYLMKKNNIDVVEGTARLEPGEWAPVVIIDREGHPTQTLAARSVILATGARPHTLPAIGLTPQEPNVWTYRDAMVPERVPSSMLIVGAGAIGVEFASFYRALGTTVTVIEAQTRILPSEDAEISAAARKALEKRGIRFRTGCDVRGTGSDGDGISLELENTATGHTEWVHADVVMLAVGVTANVQDLGLEALGVDLKDGHIDVDDNGETNIPGLFAVGDVAGAPWLAHKASHEGVRCAEYIAGQEPRRVVSPVPACTYSDPQIASVGLTEELAVEVHGEIRVGRFPFRLNGRALSAGFSEGFVKTIFEARTGRLVGAHMIGSDVSELIHSFVLAITLGATQEVLSQIIFPHPTLSEVMHESVLAAGGMALHI